MRNPYNLYETLEVERRATPATIKRSYNRLVKVHHPDKGGDPEEFRRIQEAFEVLSDPVRRERYDQTGRFDRDKVTPEAVESYLQSIVDSLLDDKSGVVDRINLVQRMQQNILATKPAILENIAAAKRKVRRHALMMRRFKPEAEFDPIGNILRKQYQSLTRQVDNHEDALRLMEEVYKVLKTYTYEEDDGVDPEPEGQSSSGSTPRRSGAFLIDSPGLRTKWLD